MAEVQLVCLCLKVVSSFAESISLYLFFIVCACMNVDGQTGSGKTFTMSGPPDNRGVNTRALDELLERAEARSSDITDTITVRVDCI
jgi:hypothetical protein